MGRDQREVVAIDWALLSPFGARRLQMRDAVTIGGNALPKDDPPDVTRFRSAAAKRVQAHRARARMGLRCLTVRVNDRQVRRFEGVSGDFGPDFCGPFPIGAIANQSQQHQHSGRAAAIHIQ